MDVKLLLVVICCVIFAVNADRPIKRSDASVANTVKVVTKLANNSKTIAKRGIFSLGHRHHHHATFSLVPASSLFAHQHKTLIKPAVAVPAVPTFVHHKPSFVPVHHHQIPTVVQTPTVIHQHTPTVVQPAFPAAVPVVPSLPPVAPPAVFKRPASVIPFTIVPGGASVTSYAVNFPRYPFIQRTPHLVPLPKPILPAVAPAPVFPAQIPVGPTILPFAPLPPPQFLPAPLPTKPIIPIAIPFPGIHKPKIPILIDNKPIFQNEFYGVNPQFVPIPVPAHPSHPTDSGTNIQPIQSTISTITVTPSQTSTTVLPSTPQTANMWRPIPSLTYTPPPTVPTITTAIPNKQREYLPPSPTPELISSTNYNQLLSGNTNANQPTQNQLQFAQQLQHQFLQQQQQQFEQQQWQQLQNFQNQQQQQQQQQQDYQTETFNLNYDAPSNNGNYNGPSSYEVPQY